MGVMATVSAAELWWHKAVERQNWLGVTLAVAAGAAAFALLDPLLPKPPEPQHLLLDEADKQVRPSRCYVYEGRCCDLCERFKLLSSSSSSSKANRPSTQKRHPQHRQACSAP
jgi:hypothetical protein